MSLDRQQQIELLRDAETKLLPVSAAGGKAHCGEHGCLVDGLNRVIDATKIQLICRRSELEYDQLQEVDAKRAKAEQIRMVHQIAVGAAVKVVGGLVVLLVLLFGSIIGCPLLLQAFGASGQ